MTQGQAGGGAGAPELIDMMGGRMEVVARLGAADGDTVLIRSQVPPGGSVPLHSHVDPECFYILSGRLDVCVLTDAARWQTVEAGRSLLVADGVKHAVRNAADAPVDLILATNVRMARFFSEAGRLVTADTPRHPPGREDVARLVETAQHYGYWLATPEESAAMTG